jgi:hypothetical protein
MSAEPVNRAKDSQEDFLRQVERLVAVTEQVDCQLDHHPLMLADQLGARRLVALCTPLHQGRFATAKI